MNAKESAEQILKHLESVYIPEHKFVIANVENFRHLDLAYYDKVQRYLEEQGFIFICNIEDLTLTEASGNVFYPVFLRVLVSKDGKIAAAIYHPKIKSLWRRVMLFVLGKKLGRIVDFESEFIDGSFICTCNAMSADVWTFPKLISSEFLHRDTKVSDLLSRHKTKINERANLDGVSFRLVRNYDDIISMQNRMNALKSAYRGEIGGITKQELDTIAPQHKDLNAVVHQEILDIQKRNG